MTDSDALPLRIRALQPGEALRLYPVFHSAVHRLAVRHYTPAQCAAWAPLPFDEAAWVQRIERNHPCVALVRGVIAGFADLQPDGTIDQFSWMPRTQGRASAVPCWPSCSARRKPRACGRCALTSA